MTLMQKIQTFNAIIAKGKKSESKEKTIIVLPKLNKEEHDEFYNSIYQKIHSAEFNPNTKTYTYTIKRKSKSVEINLIEKRNYSKKKCLQNKS